MLVATGRMFRSVRPYLDQVGIEEPVICYQGAAIVRPRAADWLFHAPLELDLAREAIAALERAGCFPNVYVDDELYVARHTAYSRAYADFQQLPVTEVGDLLEWLSRAPTKLVTVGDPEALPPLRDALRAQFGDRLFVTTSLPTLLELGNRDVSKGTGLRFVTDELGLDLERVVAFGDGENDLELLDWAGYAVSVENADDELKARSDWICPGVAEEGVAQALEAFLDSAP